MAYGIEFASILTHRSGSMFDGPLNARSHGRADGFVACRCVAKGVLSQVRS
jgi:hypothetical protein